MRAPRADEGGSRSRARRVAAGLGSPPRGGRRDRPPTSSSASTSVSGAIAMDAVLTSSARTPPSPSATSGPKSGSRTTPAMSSAPVEHRLHDHRAADPLGRRSCRVRTRGRRERLPRSRSCAHLAPPISRPRAQRMRRRPPPPRRASRRAPRRRAECRTPRARAGSAGHRASSPRSRPAPLRPPHARSPGRVRQAPGRCPPAAGATPRGARSTPRARAAASGEANVAMARGDSSSPACSLDSSTAATGLWWPESRTARSIACSTLAAVANAGRTKSTHTASNAGSASSGGSTAANVSPVAEPSRSMGFRKLASAGASLAQDRRTSQETAPAAPAPRPSTHRRRGFPRPPAFVTTATRGPRGMGWDDSSSAASRNSDSVRVRSTPDWRKSASTAASELASAAVWDAAARAPAAVEPPLRARTGFWRATRRAMRPKRARIAEALQVQRGDGRRGIVLPVLEQVVRGDVGLVAERHERGKAQAALARLLDDREAEGAALGGEADARRAATAAPRTWR